MRLAASSHNPVETIFALELTNVVVFDNPAPISTRRVVTMAIAAWPFLPIATPSGCRNSAHIQRIAPNPADIPQHRENFLSAFGRKTENGRLICSSIR